jgi:hypothetical protein
MTHDTTPSDDGGILIISVPRITISTSTDKLIDAAKARLIHRLQEMEYAVVGGNTAREDVPADTLAKWFRYVWTGEVSNDK